MEYKKGKKIKYINGIYCSKPIVKTGYILAEDLINGDEYIFVSPNKEDFKNGYGWYVSKTAVLKGD